MSRSNPAAAVRGALRSDPSWLSVPAGILASAVVLSFAPLEARASTMVAIAVFCVALWIGTPVPPWFTSLVGIGLIGVAFSTDLALVGFRSGATWLVLMGVLIGEATRRSGVAGLVERLVFGWLPGTSAGDPAGTYRYLLVVLSFASLGLALLIPSSLVRVLVLGPILISVGEVFDERRPRVGIFLGPLFSTYYGGSGVLTGSLANIIISGIVESTAGVSVGWTEWLVWMGPVMGVGRTVTIVAIAYVLYRPREGTGVADRSGLARGDLSDDERRMLLYLLVGLAVWATDVLHGLHPLYGALAVVLLAFAPRIGVVGPDAISEADFSIVFFLGAIFAIAAGLQRTGFTETAARALLSYVPADASLPVVLGFTVVASLALTLLMEGLAVASVLTPTLVSFAEGAGVALLPVAMVEAVMLNTYFFPYQSAVLVGILGLEFVGTRELIRMATLSSIATLTLLLPLQIGVFLLFF